ncbi:MAG: peptidylprolyl isomerase [Thermoanaerobaculia bacterium]
MKKMILTVVLATLTATSALAQGANPAEEKIAARVNGEVITAAQLDYLWNALPTEARQNYELAGGGKIGFLDNYIDRRLIVQEAIKEKFDKRQDVQYELERTRERVLINMYVEKVVAANVFPEAELREYYQSKRREFARPERIKARHIVVTPVAMPVYNSANDDAQSEEQAMKKIEMIKGLLADPKTSFSDLSSKYSEDLSAKSGGDLGWISRGKLSGPLEDALFKLQPGETSDVVKTEFGFHVVRCEAREPSGFLTFEEARQQIVDSMIKERQTEVISAGTKLTQELRRASSVTIHRENL